MLKAPRRFNVIMNIGINFIVCHKIAVREYLFAKENISNL